MLRKLIHIILSAILLATTTGFSVKMHYCLGEYQHSSLAWMDVDCCDLDETPPPGCCDDTIAYFQLDDDFQIQLEQQFVDIKLDLTPPQTEPQIVSFDLSIPFYSLNTAIPPPIIPDIPVFFQTFLI